MTLSSFRVIKKNLDLYLLFRLLVSLLNSLILIFVCWYCPRKRHFWNLNLCMKEHTMLKINKDWWRCHWVDWEISVCSKTTPKTPRILSRLTVCFSVYDAVMMRFMRDVVKMPYITLPSSVTSSVCWLLSAFCLCVSYCLSTYQVIYLVRIFFVFWEEFCVLYNCTFLFW